jgi:hypothetical protein
VTHSSAGLHTSLPGREMSRLSSRLRDGSFKLSSSDSGCGRSSVGASAELAEKRDTVVGDRWMNPRGLNCETGHGGDQRVNRRSECCGTARKARALRRGSKGRRGTGRNMKQPCGHCGRKAAVMSAVAPAAHRQARLCVGWESCRKRHQREQQNQKCAKCAPHRSSTKDQRRNLPVTKKACSRLRMSGALHNIYQLTGYSLCYKSRSRIIPAKRLNTLVPADLRCWTYRKILCCGDDATACLD